ncbi:hypothetical protein D3C78_1336180 [compost metagenome]
MRHPHPGGIKGKEILALVVAHAVEHGNRLLLGISLGQLAGSGHLLVALDQGDRALDQVTHLGLAVGVQRGTLEVQRDAADDTEQHRYQYHLQLQTAPQ